MSTSIEPILALQDAFNLIAKQTEFINRLLTVQEKQEDHIKRITKSLKDVIQIITEQQDNLRLQQYQIDRLYQILEEI